MCYRTCFAEFLCAAGLRNRGKKRAAAMVQVRTAISGLLMVACAGPSDGCRRATAPHRGIPPRAGWQASAAVDEPVRGAEAAASCRKWTVFPHKQAFPGSRADTQIRIATQVHEDSVEKMFVLVEPEICAAVAGQDTADKRVRVAGQITDDIFSHTGVFDGPDLAAELEQQGMCCFEEQPQLVLLQAAEGCRAERQILPETFAHGKGMIRR